MSRMITPVKGESRRGTQRPLRPQRDRFSLRALRTLRSLCCSLAFFGVSLHAHDLEKTTVSIVFSRDGSFVADVANDPAWLKLRLESIPGPFADRVVFWVDGKEIRPESAARKNLSARRYSEALLNGHTLELSNSRP